jgi:Tol biopolymer transport system component
VRRALVLLPVAIACSDLSSPVPDPTPPGTLTVEVSGRLERGSTIIVIVKAHNEAVVAPSAVTWTSIPDGAIHQLSPNELRLLRDGGVTLQAATDDAEGALAIQVATPPTIVFERQVNGNQDIWRVALDGGDLVRLTTDPGQDQNPTVANGTVVFTTTRHGNAELYAMPLAGGSEQRLTTTTRNEVDPALSRNGDRLAFATDATGIFKLWTAQANGGAAARATTSFGFAGSVEVAPAWSPGGDRVVFVSTNSGSADLAIIALATGIVTPLAASAAADVSPAWSFDGERVAFASTRDGGDTELYTVIVQSGVVTRLTTRAGIDGDPTWLPDGRLVYAAWINDVPRLRWWDPVTSQLHDLDTGDGEARHPHAAP